MPILINYPQRLIIDPEFIRWILSKSQKNIVISALLRINISSKYNRKNHNILLNEDLNSLLSEKIAKDNTLLKGGLSPFEFPEEIKNFIVDKKSDEITQRILMGILCTEDEPFRAVIITTKENVKKYSENEFFNKVKDLTVKEGDEAIQLVLSFFNDWKNEKDSCRL